MGNLKPIETIYKGYRFRSRLEARWAVFFDTLGIEWEYEIQGYESSHVKYLPDFKLKELLVEVKPPDWYPEASCKELRFAREYGKDFLVLSGNPWPWEYVAWDCIDGFFVPMPTAAFAYCSKCKGRRLLISSLDGERPLAGIHDFSPPSPCGHVWCWLRPSERPGKSDSDLEMAYVSARQSRFEWGESGARTKA